MFLGCKFGAQQGIHSWAKQGPNHKQLITKMHNIINKIQQNTVLKFIHKRQASLVYKHKPVNEYIN